MLAIPPKRYEHKLITYLSDQEVQPLLNAPDRTTWTGRRDFTWLVLAIQTGLRISELVNPTCDDVALGAGTHVRCVGKGRKHRATPLVPETVTVLKTWLRERQGDDDAPLFPTSTGRHLSRDPIATLT